jgi:hypothetical protein
MAHQIGLFCMLQLADRACLEADQSGGDVRVAGSNAHHAV